MSRRDRSSGGTTNGRSHASPSLASGNQEARQLARCQRVLGLRVPTLYAVDLRSNSIVMEYLDGVTVKAWLRTYPLPEAATAPLSDPHAALAQAIGHNLARLHDHSVVHGDLTTSNMLVLSRGTPETPIVVPCAIADPRGSAAGRPNR